jgi:hypothetical protein
MPELVQLTLMTTGLGKTRTQLTILPTFSANTAATLYRLRRDTCSSYTALS